MSEAFVKDEDESVLLCIDTTKVQPKIIWEDFDRNGISYPHIYGALNMDSVIDVVPFVCEAGKWKGTNCVHILMNTCHFDEEWCYPYIHHYVHEYDRVCVVAFSFWEDIKTKQDWDALYSKERGLWYASNTDVWNCFGIEKGQIEWINYFEDTKQSAKDKIINSTIVMFTGGAPDLMMKRIHEFALKEVLERYQGTMMGYCAGAMMQLKHYHITPDTDYPGFSYERGLSMLDGFDIEVHFEDSIVQQQYIKKVLEEKGVDVYALYDDGGLIVYEDTIEVFGNVRKFST